MPLQDFLLTSAGHVTEEQPRINPTRVAAVGFALAGSRDLQPNGPFRLSIARIAAGYHAHERSWEE